jgi:citrate/tricarballylate utilization protein
VLVALSLAAVMIVLLFAATLVANPERSPRRRNARELLRGDAPRRDAGAVRRVGAYVLVALAMGARRFRRDGPRPEHGAARGRPQRGLRASRGTARRAHVAAPARERRAVHDSRRSPHAVAPSFHHATFYGFVLCFASTAIAALYHVLGLEAPYAVASVPVVLGTLGGIGVVTVRSGF